MLIIERRKQGEVLAVYDVALEGYGFI